MAPQPLPRAEAMRWLDAFIAGGRFSTRARKWVQPRQDGRRLPFHRRPDDPQDERRGSLGLLYNPLLAGVALLVEDSVVLTVITDSRPRIPVAPMVVVADEAVTA